MLQRLIAYFVDIKKLSVYDDLKSQSSTENKTDHKSEDELSLSANVVTTSRFNVDTRLNQVKDALRSSELPEITFDLPADTR